MGSVTRELLDIEDERNSVVPATLEEFDGNALIAQLKEKSAENKAKNGGILRQKTLANKLVRLCLSLLLLLLVGICLIFGRVYIYIYDRSIITIVMSFDIVFCNTNFKPSFYYYN